MTFKQVSLQNGARVQYVGVYVLKWNFDCGQPEVGFTEIEYSLQDALGELDRAALSPLAKNEIIKILNKLAGNDEPTKG